MSLSPSRLKTGEHAHGPKANSAVRRTEGPQ